jgi:hypothetical protein
MFGTTFWTFDLSTNVIDQAVHAGLHTKAVLAWQKLRIPVAVQADGACQQLLKLLHAFCKWQFAKR